MVGGYRFVALLLTEDQCALERSIYLYYRICYGLTSLNTLLDPLFYIFLCQNARLELQRSLPCLACSRRSEGPWLLTRNMCSCQGQTGFFVLTKKKKPAGCFYEEKIKMLKRLIWGFLTDGLSELWLHLLCYWVCWNERHTDATCQAVICSSMMTTPSAKHAGSETKLKVSC